MAAMQARMEAESYAVSARTLADGTPQHQSFGLGRIPSLAWDQDEVHGVSVSIGEHVDLCPEPAATAPKRRWSPFLGGRPR